jgi:hypothetical protein
MGLLSRKAAKPATRTLEPMLALAPARAQLEAATGLRSTGVGAVCLKPAAGKYGALPALVQPFLDATTLDGDRKYVDSTDSHDHRWLTRRTSHYDLAGLVKELHGVNAALDDAGLGTAVLCTLVGFRAPDNQPFGLVYLAGRGAWYPFAPTGPTQRDSVRELELRGPLSEVITVESDLSRWSPLWGAPVFDAPPDAS